MPKLTLHSDHLRAGATFIEAGGWELPEDYGDSNSEYLVVREGAGLIDWSARGKLWVTGSDRHRFLGGMVTNRVEGMAVGEGNHSSLTDAQGHTLVELWVHNRESGLHLETDPGLQGKLADALDKYLIADDVEISDVTDQEVILGVVGPESKDLIGRVFGDVPVDLSEFHSIDLNWVGVDVRLVFRPLGKEFSFHLWVASQKAQMLWGALCDAGGIPVGHRVLEILRIESGVPRYGIDFDERVMPLEAGLYDTVDFEKGCYIGQEPIAKMHYRGKPRRNLVGLKVLADFPPAPETPISVEGRDVGWVTSSVRSVALEETIALASIRRSFAIPGQSVMLGGKTSAEVVALPFYTKEGNSA